jgi:Zn-dependent protease with chaperone function
MFRFVSVLAFSLALALTAHPLQAQTKSQVRAIKKGLVTWARLEIQNKPVILRGSIHENPKTYYGADGNTFYYEHLRRYPNVFRVREDEPVVVTKVTGSDDYVTVFFKSKRLGKGAVQFSSTLHEPVIDKGPLSMGFGLCFKSPGEDSKVSPITGNTVSMKYHVSGCNHLPENENRAEFTDRPDADSAGYAACKLCFMSVPLMSDYGKERMLGLHVAQNIQLLGQLATDDELQNAADRIGQKVLDNWPVPLQGYDYRFRVMEDAEINAYAVPTGFVYVNRGLLEIAESELEVEAVIAHEVAHVERRHGLRIYRNHQKRAALGAGIGLLAAAIAGAKAKNNKAETMILVGGLSTLFVNGVTNALYEGYPRSMEEEADAMAALYLENLYGAAGPAAMIAALRKLRYYSDYMGGQEKELLAFRSHPLLDDRIASFSNSEVKIFTEPIRIVGRQSGGGEIVSITLTAQRRIGENITKRYSLDPTQVLGHITATADINKPRKFKDITLTAADGTKIKLDNKEDSLVGPYEDEGFMLRGDVAQFLDQLQFNEVKVNIPQTRYKWSVE